MESCSVRYWGRVGIYPGLPGIVTDDFSEEKPSTDPKNDPRKLESVLDCKIEKGRTYLNKKPLARDFRPVLRFFSWVQKGGIPGRVGRCAAKDFPGVEAKGAIFPKLDFVWN